MTKKVTILLVASLFAWVVVWVHAQETQPQVYLPLVVTPPEFLCPTSSSNQYVGGLVYQYDTDNPVRPADAHADKNIALRGYQPNLNIAIRRGLVDYGSGDPTQPPQLATLFAPYRVPAFAEIHQINHWQWAPSPTPGTRGTPIQDYPATAVALTVSAGEPLHAPLSGYDIGGGMEVIVLFADEDTITLHYTREDSAANGYTIHIDQICTDPNLLSLYDSLDSENGPRYQYPNASYDLPTLATGQILGTAGEQEVMVAIVDTGAFQDPRSCNEWWQIRPNYGGACPPREQ